MKFPEWIMFTALVIAASSALAREPEHAHNPQPTMSQRANSFARYDADRDGVLSRAELGKHPMGAHAAMADANRDGLLDKAEFAALEAM